MNIAFAINNSYVPHLEIALFSLLENNKSADIKIYIISSDISAFRRKRLERLCDLFKNATVDFIELSEDIFKDLKVIEHFSRDMYVRYLLPNLLPDSDKVLYLDADILVTGGLARLYDLDIDDYFAAGVRDIGISKAQFKDYLKELGLGNENYFNSGVLLLNLDYLRRNDIVNKLFSKTKELNDSLRHPDQDVINIVFRNKIKEVANKWNFQDEDRKLYKQSKIRPTIIHYTTARKPWNTPNICKDYNLGSHLLYDEYEFRYRSAIGEVAKVSIVIPVYNTKKQFLDECLNSILKQTYAHIEVIFVDDGSDKVTANYLKMTTRLDSRVRVIRKQNAGTNRARQTGYKESSGDYIAFVDADDILSPNYIQRLFFSCIDNRTEMSMCEYWDDTEEALINSAENFSNSYVLRDKSKASLYGVIGFPGMRVPSGVVWAKLYDKRLIERIDWDLSDYKLTEDEFFTLQTLAIADGQSLIKDQMYYYRRDVSTSKEYSYPLENTFKGKPVPLLRTAADLYEKSLEVYEGMNIAYDNDILINRYLFMVEKFVNQLITQGSLDHANKVELNRQYDKYFEKVYNNPIITERRKMGAAIVLKAPELLSMFNEFVVNQELVNENKIAELDKLEKENSSLNLEISRFLGVKRSARLFAGNIKRKIRIRTRLRHIIKKIRELHS